MPPKRQLGVVRTPLDLDAVAAGRIDVATRLDRRASLERRGVNVQNWIDVLKRLGPLTLSTWNATTVLAPTIVAAVAGAEEMLNASGSDKKTYALRMVDAGVTAMNVAAGEQVLDPAHAHAVASIAIDALVATVNVWTKTAIGN